MTAIDLTAYDLAGLIGADTPLRKVASTRGGELAGPCPVCGGRDRLHVQPTGGGDGRGIWSCRQCHPRWSDAIEYAIFRGHAVDFRGACEVLRVDLPERTPRPLEESAPPACQPPSAAWQAMALDRAQEAADLLWTDAGSRPRSWLASRGYSDDTIFAAGLGYNPSDRYDSREAWGLVTDADHKRVWTPAGVVIPWAIGAEAWRLNVRRPVTAAQLATGEPKYIGPAGSANGLYNAHNLRPGRPAIVVEGEFDALAIWQAARGLITPVALGSTGGARRVRWLSRLALCSAVLVATDADEAGEQAADYWLRVLANARRWRPFVKDASAMLEAGMDIRGWIEAGLE